MGDGSGASLRTEWLLSFKISLAMYVPNTAILFNLYCVELGSDIFQEQRGVSLLFQLNL